VVVDPAADQEVVRESVMRKSAEEMHADVLKAVQPVVAGARMIVRVKKIVSWEASNPCQGGTAKMMMRQQVMVGPVALYQT